ncbi:MAG: glycosyltransferase family 2 protein [Deltaproteobacteria bacterium]
MEPKISVVLPVHNCEKYVADAVESALSQTYPAWEIIAVDDGSTDDTHKILESFAGKITIRTIKRSGSPAVPRNVGIQWSTGNYIAFLDAQDVWFKDKLRKQAEIVQRYPEAGFVCGDFVTREADRRLRRHFTEQAFPHELDRRLICFNKPMEAAFKLLLEMDFVGCASTVLLSKRVIDRIGGLNPMYPCAEDYEYWFRCARYTRFLILSDILAYRRRPEVLAASDDIGMLENHKRVLLEVFSDHREYLREQRLLDDCFAQLALINRNQAVYYSGIGEKKQALKLCLQSLLFSCSPDNLGFWFRASMRMLSHRLSGLRRRSGMDITPRNRVFDESGTDGRLNAKL